MLELAYMQEQHASAAPQARDAEGLSALLAWERTLAAKCGRGVLQRLAVPPNTMNVELTASRLRRIQQEHDAYLETVTRPGTVSDADWAAFRTAWSAAPVLDMNVLCEYCAETGRSLRKTIRSGRGDPFVIGERVRAVCRLGRLLPETARSERRAQLDFYQQGILDLRRLRAALQSAGLDDAPLEESVAAMEADKRRLKC